MPPIACFISLITIAEIRLGIERKAAVGDRAMLEAWLHDGVRVWFGNRILAPDEDVLLVWTRLSHEGRKSGYTFSQPDGLLAAPALVHDLGVVTRNVSDFERAAVPLLNPWQEVAPRPRLTRPRLPPSPARHPARP